MLLLTAQNSATTDFLTHCALLNTHLFRVVMQSACQFFVPPRKPRLRQRVAELRGRIRFVTIAVMITRWMFMYCAFCLRLRNVLTEAPWSSFDLVAGSLVWWVGAYAAFCPDALAVDGGRIVSALGSPDLAAAVFLLFGLLGWAVACWPSRPPFALRLAARAGIAYCLILLMAEDLARDPPPLSVATHATLVVAASWGVLRTRVMGG